MAKRLSFFNLLLLAVIVSLTALLVWQINSRISAPTPRTTRPAPKPLGPIVQPLVRTGGPRWDGELTDPEEFRRVLEDTILDALAWFQPLLESKMGGDTMIQLELVAQRYPEYRAFVDAYEEKWGPIKHPMMRNLRKSMVGDTSNPNIRAKIGMSGLGKTLYCDLIPLPEEYVQRIASQELPSTGKEAIYASLCMMFMKGNGCIEAEIADEFLDRAGRAIHKGQVEDHEYTMDCPQRVMYLYLLGKGDLVEQRWLEETVANRNDDGGWSWWPGIDSQSLPTGFAVAAMAFYLEGKPHQTWYPIIPE